MPKKSERERFAELVERQKKVSEEIEAARAQLRGRYARIVSDLPVEEIAERDFREILGLVLKVGGPAAVAALKGAPPKS